MTEAPVKGRYCLDDHINVVLHDGNFINLLSRPDPLGGGWKGLASRLNYTYDDMCKFEQTTDPCRALLHDWQTKQASTIRVFERAVQNRYDVLARLHELMKGEFELLGVLQRNVGSEEISVVVSGKITLREAFEEKIWEKGLHVDNLYFVHSNGTRSFTISWDSPAYTQKGQQVTFKEKSNAVQLRPSEKPSSLRKVTSEIDASVTLPPRRDPSCQSYHQMSNTRGTRRPLPPLPLPDRDATGERLVTSDGEDETIYANIHEANVAVNAPEVSPEATCYAVTEWEFLPGWHSLGRKGNKKRAIHNVLCDHLHADGNYILTPNLAKGEVLLNVTYQNAIRSFRVYNRKNAREGEPKYFITKQFFACSAKEFIAHYTTNILMNNVEVKLRYPIPYNSH